jgi:dsDNA-binding SOS-regulon protein
MAVITRYIVVRNGVELDKVFTDKKKAEAWDRMLEAAEQLAGLIKAAELDPPIEPAVVDAIGVFLAENGPRVTRILKGVKPVAALATATDKASGEAPVQPRAKSGPRAGRGPAKSEPS